MDENAGTRAPLGYKAVPTFCAEDLNGEVAPQTIYRAIRHWGLPHLRIGRRVLVNPGEFLDFTRRVEHKPEAPHSARPKPDAA